MTNRFLSKSQVLDITGLSHVTQWRMEKRGEFPTRRQISPNRVGWLESEIVAWVESRPISAIDPVMNSEEAAA